MVKASQPVNEIPYFRQSFFDTSFQKDLSLTPHNLKHVLLRFVPLIEISLQAEGVFVECGIGYGRTLQIITTLLLLKDKSRVVFGFDSFEGFPEPTKEDLTGKVYSKQGDWKYVKPHHIYEIISPTQGFTESVETRIYPGFFEDSISQEILADIESLNGIAFLHLDVDLYQSYICTLSRFWDLVNKGGVILFDEYHLSSQDKFPGAYKAVNEFLVSKGIDPQSSIRTDGTGRCYLIKE